MEEDMIELIGTDQCGICGEHFTNLDVENGHVAEMYGLHGPFPDGVICHLICGTNKGLELS